MTEITSLSLYDLGNHFGAGSLDDGLMVPEPPLAGGADLPMDPLAQPEVGPYLAPLRAETLEAVPVAWEAILHGGGPQGSASTAGPLVRGDRLDPLTGAGEGNIRLASGLLLVRESITGLLDRPLPSTLTLLEEVFGGRWDPDLAMGVLRDLSRDQAGPALVVLPSAALDGRGAYAAANETVYLSADLVEKGTAQQIASTLVEEWGHHLDARLNPSDSAGDEGEHFARRLAGETLSAADRAAILAEDDHGTVLLNGAAVAVEYAASGGSGGLEALAGDASRCLAGSHSFGTGSTPRCC